VTADIPKMAIITPFGLFEYHFMPVGLSNAAQNFQLMMDCTLDGLEGFHTWTIPESDLQTGKRTFLTWKLFLQHWPPMVSRLTWTSVFFLFQLWNFLATTYWRQDQPRSRHRHQNMPPPSGHQAIATLSRHGEFLPPFFAKLQTGVAPFNRSPEGGPKTLEWIDKAQEAFKNAKLLLAALVLLQHPFSNAELSPLMPQIPISAASCSKNRGTIGDLLVFSLKID
jgi:hypothetical protein